MKNKIRVSKEKMMFGATVCLINVIFAIDIFTQWGIYSGMLYLSVLPIAWISADKKDGIVFAGLASVYMIFEVIVLSHQQDVIQNIKNHSLAFIVLWVMVCVMQFVRSKNS
ncbi:MAG: hypothetical protein KC713_00370 [Candidatus Omnitrophica bacterium]|nr:hypothetical protein [Candidatus Omnitrophota bacterium]